MTYSKLKIPIIIGLCGKAGAGKDTVADFLYKEYGIVKVAFADDLKRKAMSDFNLNYEQVYGTKKEVIIPEYNKSPRQILQLMGTEWYRSIDNNYWVKALYKYLETVQNFSKGVCITDVRFENELDFVNQVGGISIKITRPNHSQTIHSFHTSETTVDKINCLFEIANDGTKEEVYHKVKVLMKNLLEGVNR